MSLRICAFISAALAMPLTCAQTLAQEALYQRYGIYPIVPMSAEQGLGAVMVGYFNDDLTELRVRTQGGDGLICGTKIPITTEMLRDCSSRQPSLGHQKQADQNLDISLKIKQLLGVSAAGKYVRKATLKVTDACLFQLPSVEAQKLLDTDKDCRKFALEESRRLARVSLQERIANRWLMIWQTTRVLYGKYEYVVEFSSNTSGSVKTEAEKVIKDIGGSLSGGVSNSGKLELKGDGFIIGLAPRYYEHWYKTAPADEARVSQAVRDVARRRNALRTLVAQKGAGAAVPTEIKRVQDASAATDAAIEASLK